jgi:hypothetical protein
VIVERLGDKVPATVHQRAHQQIPERIEADGLDRGREVRVVGYGRLRHYGDQLFAHRSDRRCEDHPARETDYAVFAGLRVGRQLFGRRLDQWSLLSDQINDQSQRFGQGYGSRSVARLAVDTDALALFDQREMFQRELMQLGNAHTGEHR